MSSRSWAWGSRWTCAHRHLLRPLWAASFLLLVPLGIANAAPPPGYYAAVDLSNPSAHAATLHAVIDDHTRFPYTSGSTDTWDILEAAQEDPNDPGAILDVYRNASYPKQGGGNAFYDREHTWPRSFGFPDDGISNYPFTDAHLLHLAAGSYNGARSNRPFGDCAATCSSWRTVANDGQGGATGPYPDDDNWTSGPGGIGGVLGRWETWTGRRGDVARALLYGDIRYEGGTHGVTGFVEPDLVLTDDEALIAASSTGNNESVAYMGILSELLEWHAEDPVDDFERDRNDVVFSFQGNRNPFVDHPEWVAMLYSPAACSTNTDCDDGFFCNGAETCVMGDCQAGPPPCASGEICDETSLSCEMPAPAGSIFINEIHYDNGGTDVGEFFELAGPAGASLGGWSLVGYNGATGALYASFALSGTFPDQGGCAGTLAFDFPGMQNGSPDGLALVDGEGMLVQFVSYEGSFAVSSGPAAGETSADIGVEESFTTPTGYSLQLAGSGSASTDFSWQGPIVDTRSGVNSGQTLAMCTPTAVPSVDGSRLVLLSLLMLSTATLLLPASWTLGPPGD